ncbi:hypothetical protein ACET3Z_000371 [Daucus carota]
MTEKEESAVRKTGGESPEVKTPAASKSAVAAATPPEVEVVKCECCEFTEECTIAYIARVRERYEGRWICGLCAEAVKDEIGRSGRRISEEEALERHASFCEEFRSPPEKPAEELISAVKQLLIRSLESPTSVRSNPSSPRGKDGSDLARATFGRSQSCFPSMDA